MTRLNSEDASIAKQFLVARVLDQAIADGVLLCEDEKVMLGFSEPNASAEELRIAHRFEMEHDSDAFEAKAAKLLRHAYMTDKEVGNEAQWRQSLRSVSAEDRYLLVMVEQAGIKIPGRSSGIGKREVLTLMTLPNVGIVILGMAGWLFFFPVRDIHPTPWRINLIHNDVLTVVLFALWIATLWLLGELSRKT